MYRFPLLIMDKLPVNAIVRHFKRRYIYIVSSCRPFPLTTAEWHQAFLDFIKTNLIASCLCYKKEPAFNYHFKEWAHYCVHCFKVKGCDMMHLCPNLLYCEHLDCTCTNPIENGYAIQSVAICFDCAQKKDTGWIICSTSTTIRAIYCFRHSFSLRKRNLCIPLSHAVDDLRKPMSLTERQQRIIALMED